MSNLKWQILSRVIRRLDQMGFTYSVNKRMAVSTRVEGYKVVVVDIAIFSKNEIPIVALYLGPRKERRVLKHKMLKIPVFYFHTLDIETEFEKMVAMYTSRIV